MVGIVDTITNGLASLGATTNGQHNGTSRPYPPKLDYEKIEAREHYSIPDHGFQDPNARKHRVIGIGAGASGIVSNVQFGASIRHPCEVPFDQATDNCHASLFLPSRTYTFVVPRSQGSAKTERRRTGNLRKERRYRRRLA